MDLTYLLRWGASGCRCTYRSGMGSHCWSYSKSSTTWEWNTLHREVSLLCILTCIWKACIKEVFKLGLHLVFTKNTSIHLVHDVLNICQNVAKPQSHCSATLIETCPDIAIMDIATSAMWLVNGVIEHLFILSGETKHLSSSRLGSLLWSYQAIILWTSVEW